MPLTDLQRQVLAIIGRSRTPDSYLAGGAALHFKPNSLRFSNDLDFFHDSEARVASAYAEDRASLLASGFQVDVELSQPGFVRATVHRGGESTRIDGPLRSRQAGCRGRLPLLLRNEPVVRVA